MKTTRDKIIEVFKEELFDYDVESSMDYNVEQVDLFADKLADRIIAIQEEAKDKWISVKDELPEEGFEVIGFNKSWKDLDYNPNGQMICTLMDDGWISARWNALNDCYMNEDNEVPTHWMPLPELPTK